ncbi:hypothetical protein D3C72_2242160 [compost metagenome]
MRPKTSEERVISAPDRDWCAKPPIHSRPIATYGLVNKPIIPGPIISSAPMVTTILRDTIRFTPNQRWNSGGR